MTIKTLTLQMNTKGNADVHDLTDLVNDALASTDFKDGIVTIFCPSSTSALTTLEFEKGCLSDLQRLFEEIIPSTREYAHNARWGDGNGHSHIRSALLGASLTVPFVNRQLSLGTWQQVIYVDFDVRPRQRQVVLQFIGE